MNGSGKEVLLHILSELSTQMRAQDAMPEATRRLRAGLLVHGSTAEESVGHARQLVWGSDETDGEVVRQGIATKSGVFLSDILESILEMPGLHEHLQDRYPALGYEELEATDWALWLLVSSVQMFSQLVSIEGKGDIDVDAWVDAYAEKFEQEWEKD